MNIVKTAIVITVVVLGQSSCKVRKQADSSGVKAETKQADTATKLKSEFGGLGQKTNDVPIDQALTRDLTESFAKKGMTLYEVQSYTVEKTGYQSYRYLNVRYSSGGFEVIKDQVLDVINLDSVTKGKNMIEVIAEMNEFIRTTVFLELGVSAEPEKKGVIGDYRDTLEQKTNDYKTYPAEMDMLKRSWSVASAVLKEKGIAAELRSVEGGAGTGQKYNITVGGQNLTIDFSTNQTELRSRNGWNNMQSWEMGRVHRITPASSAGARILTYEFIAQIESAANNNSTLRNYLVQKVGGNSSDLDRLENSGADATTAEMVQEMRQDVNRIRAKVGYGTISVGAPELKDQKDFVEKGAQEVLDRVQRGEFKSVLTDTDIARLSEITEKMRQK